MPCTSRNVQLAMADLMHPRGQRVVIEARHDLHHLQPADHAQAQKSDHMLEILDLSWQYYQCMCKYDLAFFDLRWTSELNILSCIFIYIYIYCIYMRYLYVLFRLQSILSGRVACHKDRANCENTHKPQKRPSSATALTLNQLGA